MIPLISLDSVYLFSSPNLLAILSIIYSYGKILLPTDSSFIASEQILSMISRHNSDISVFTSNVNDEPSIYTRYISGVKMYNEPNGEPSEENNEETQG